jgi:hypothetical protein
MAIREFEAHEWKKKPTKVSFTTKKGESVRFTLSYFLVGVKVQVSCNREIA